MNAGRRVGRLIVTTCRQPGGAPFVDYPATTTDAEHNRYVSAVVKPSLRAKRDRRGGRAFVIGWRRGPRQFARTEHDG